MKLCIARFTIHHSIPANQAIDDTGDTLYKDVGGKDTGVRFYVVLRDDYDNMIHLDEAGPEVSTIYHSGIYTSDLSI